MSNLRNFAIVAVLAALVAFAPAGGNVADVIVTAIVMAFLAAISWTVYLAAQRNEMTLAALSDGSRGVLYAACGTLALLVAGSDEMFASGLGTLVWILLLAAAVGAIWKVWTAAQSY